MKSVWNSTQGFFALTWHAVYLGVGLEDTLHQKHLLRYSLYGTPVCALYCHLGVSEGRHSQEQHLA